MGKNVMHDGEMHIACPNCQAVYDVPESKLDNALSLRCCACNYSWPLGPVKAAGRPGAASGTARQPQPEVETVGQASPEPQQSGSVSSVTVASMTVSSVTVTSNQPAATAEAVADTQPEPEPEPSFTRTRAQPAPVPTPSPSSEEEADPVAHFVPLSTDKDQNESSKKPDSRTGGWTNGVLWVALVALIVLTLAIVARQEVIKWLPVSGKLFKALGLA